LLVRVVDDEASGSLADSCGVTHDSYDESVHDVALPEHRFGRKYRTFK
jgi:hypothetical protein